MIAVKIHPALMEPTSRFEAARWTITVLELTVAISKEEKVVK
jgi:hypothetical protein